MLHQRWGFVFARMCLTISCGVFSIACMPQLRSTESTVLDAPKHGARPEQIEVIGPLERPARFRHADSSKGPRPLLLVLHGFGMDVDSIEALLHVPETQRLLNAHAIIPDGRRDANEKRYWEATDACCDFGNKNPPGRTDETYLLGLLDEAEYKAEIDRERVYLVGFSNGSFMAQRLACSHADRFAGVASFSGAGYLDISQCQPSRPIPMIHLHGTKDPVIQYEGGVQKAAYPSAVQTTKTWADRAGCRTPELLPAATKLTQFDYDLSGSPVPTLAELAGRVLPGNEVDITRYLDCEVPLAIELWTLNGLGHAPIYLKDTLTRVINALQK